MANIRISIAILVLALSAVPAVAATRLDAIKARGALVCGVAVDDPGMAARDASGTYRGFEVDICRAIATAIFGAPKVDFRPTPALQQFLSHDDIDVVLRGLTWTFRRETGGNNLRFGPIVLYDGQSVLTRRSARLTSIAALSGHSICVSSDIFADFLPPLEAYFRRHHLILKARLTRTRTESEKIFFSGGCEAMTADSSELAAAVLAHGAPADFAILDRQITREPLAPLLHKGDDRFYDIVRWAIFALIDAEELGINSSNVASMRNRTDPAIKAFFAAPPKGSGFASDWSAAIIHDVGNYGEIFDRHLGAGGARLPRGLNRLWTEGGLLYAPPVR